VILLFLLVSIHAGLRRHTYTAGPEAFRDVDAVHLRRSEGEVRGARRGSCVKEIGFSGGDGSVNVLGVCDDRRERRHWVKVGHFGDFLKGKGKVHLKILKLEKCKKKRKIVTKHKKKNYLLRFPPGVILAVGGVTGLVSSMEGSSSTTASWIRSIDDLIGVL